MIKNELVSSLELLSLSKPRVTLVLKNLIDCLIYLLFNNYSDNLEDFNKLYSILQAKNILDISSYITQNITNYDIQINNKIKTKANILLFFNLHFFFLVCFVLFQFPTTHR